MVLSISAALWLLLLAAGLSEAAFIISCPPGAADAVRALAVPTSTAAVMAVLPGGAPRRVPLPPDVTLRTGCYVPDLGYLVFSTEQAWLLEDHDSGTWVRIPGAPDRVRQAASLGGFLLGLLIDTPDGARVDLHSIEESTGIAPIHTACPPASRPQWIAAGRTEDAPHLLVGVLTVAVFDPVLNLRPWLYRLSDDRLEPAWLGTSFARPFSTVAFGDVVDGGGDEICSLERDAAGLRLITAYARYGFLVEGVAQSGAAEFGECLWAARLREDADAICAWVGGDTGHIGAYAAPEYARGRLASLVEIAATAPMQRPAAWGVVGDGRRLTAVIVDAAAQTTCEPMVARGAEPAL